MTIDQIMTTLINELFPSAAQFIMVLIALVGLTIIFLATRDVYQLISGEADGRNGGNATVSSSLVRMVIGGLMVVPSAVLWRTADLFLDGASQTETNVLAYISGAEATTSCDRFADAIQLMFLVVGLIAIFFAFRNADDQARGFNMNGNRTAITYFIGGILCVFIVDIFAIISAQIGIDLGLPQLCAALG